MQSTVQRERLPATRESITHKVVIGGTCKIYFTVGLFPDGRPGELFVLIDREGSGLAGIYDCWGIAVSMLLQSGWPLRDIERKFAHIRCEPSGMTDDPAIPFAKSPVDYIIRWMVKYFNPTTDNAPDAATGMTLEPEDSEKQDFP